jgi:hypothetical protein
MCTTDEWFKTVNRALRHPPSGLFGTPAFGQPNDDRHRCCGMHHHQWCPAAFFNSVGRFGKQWLSLDRVAKYKSTEWRWYRSNNMLFCYTQYEVAQCRFTLNSFSNILSATENIEVRPVGTHSSDQCGISRAWLVPRIFYLKMLENKFKEKSYFIIVLLFFLNILFHF